jgi:drug/metabolite transporter (DMT)-like permease
VVLTPVLGALIARRFPRARVAAAAALATAGLAVLSLRGLAVGPGELLTAASAFVYALHILGLSAWSRPEDVYASAFGQMVVAAALCTVAAAPGGIALPHGGEAWLAMLYLAVAAGALAIIAQTWAQAHLPAARAAIIMTLEPVWASTFAVLLGGEAVSGRLLGGGALVLAAMALAELPLGRRVRAEGRRAGSAPSAGAGRARRGRWWRVRLRLPSPTRRVTGGTAPRRAGTSP